MHSLALLVALTLSAPPAAAPAAPSVDNTAVFERLKKLEGSWKTDAKDGPVQYVMLRLVAGGSAVLETVTAADRTTVTSVTVYAFEGTELIATIHGPGGMSRLKVKDADPGTLKFDGSSKDARVAAVALVIKDSKLREEFTTRESGRDVKKSIDLLREYVDTLK
jgi:hypothetical protein